MKILSEPDANKAAQPRPGDVVQIKTPHGLSNFFLLCVDKVPGQPRTEWVHGRKRDGWFLVALSTGVAYPMTQSKLIVRRDAALALTPGERA